MATKASTTKPKWTEQKVIDAYSKYLLLHGERPKSVFQFADSLGVSEQDFYAFFSSFDALEEHIWTALMENTITAVKTDSNYNSFSVQEKLLAFYFTHLQILLTKRSYVAMRWPDLKRNARTPEWLRKYKQHFIDYARDLVSEGIEKKEIVDRPYLSNRYDKAMWFQLMFVVDYWIKDNSKDFENSDAAVEKAVNLSFKLLGESTIDSAIDFAKFIWQSK